MPASDPAAMACPHCQVPLTMSERQGIEIDYCPQCRGVWLDRGELDKIVERAARDAAPAAPQPPAPQPPVPPQGYAPQPPYPPRSDPYRHEQQRHDQHYSKHRKPKHWLSEIFD